jgi:hypothetical protein
LGETVTFDEIKAIFLEANPLHLSSNDWAFKHLATMNAEAKGRWERRHLSHAEVLQIKLMHHNSEGGKEPLLPEAWFPLETAVARLRERGTAYAAKNPICWERISYHRGKPSTIYVIQREDGLYHVDGIHRLLAWGLWGGLENGLDAYVALGFPVS